MKISLNWLEEYLGNIKDTEELLTRLTSMGLEVDSVSKVKGDIIVDLDMTPNRADCLSIYGIARDLGAIYKKSITLPKVTRLSNRTKKNIKSVNSKISTSYGVLSIEDFDNSIKTPSYISDRLKKSEISQINFIVDVLNYVMLELGQPMHVFDGDKINGRLSVRFAKKEEHMTALDGNKYDLSSEIPVIADNNGPQAIAGVIGSSDSSVNKKSKSIIIESAYFKPTLIRKSSKKYRIQTESSYRFERGVDPLLSDYAIGRVLDIIRKHSKLNKHQYNYVCSKPIASHIKRSIIMDMYEFERLLGEKIPKKFIVATLSFLGFSPVVTKNRLKVSIPSHRFDISIAADLVEEIARVYGYDNFSEKHLPLSTISSHATPKPSINSSLDLFSSRGYSEIISFSFLPRDSQKIYSAQKERIDVLNPISEDKSEMRTTMMYGLLKTAKYNISRQNSNIKLYEIGKVYKKHRDNIITEEIVLGGLISGINYESNLKQLQNDVDFFSLKGDLSSIFPALTFTKNDKTSFLSATCQANIIQDKKIVGLCGEPSMEIYNKFGIKNKVYYFEIYTDLLDLDNKVKFRPISIFPRVQRDITMLINNEISGDDIVDAIKRKSFNYMINSKISDIFYNKREFGSNKKSMTIELIFQDNTRTLLDEDVNTEISNIIRYLQDKFKAIIRK